MLVESIICPPTPSYPYHIAAKRYFVHKDRGSVAQQYECQDEDLTLVFFHSMSFPKEMWEPTIEDIFQRHDRPGTRIREAYAIDCPNHGMAAALNDGLLGECAGMVKSNISLHSNCHFRNIIPHHGVSPPAGTKLFATCVMQFLLNGPTLSTPVDFSKRNLVGIGHSFGGVSV